jgi:hypothetical protein
MSKSDQGQLRFRIRRHNHLSPDAVRHPICHIACHAEIGADAIERSRSVADGPLLTNAADREHVCHQGLRRTPSNEYRGSKFRRDFSSGGVAGLACAAAPTVMAAMKTSGVEAGIRANHAGVACRGPPAFDGLRPDEDVDELAAEELVAQPGAQ